MAVSVVVDDREPASLVAAFRAHPDVADVEVSRLTAGDVAIGPVGFERKTVGDYLGSVLGRTGTNLREQVQGMVESYAHAYVLVEGTFHDVEEHWAGVEPATVRGTVASITARLGVPVVPCGDRERLVDMAVRLARKHTEEPTPRPLSASAVTGRDEPVAKRIYGCIDGIGPRTADTLYETFPTVESLLAASRADLLAIDGVGPTRADAIYDAFRTDG